MNLFCKALGAAINCNKGFWISFEAEPVWKPNVEFKWIAKGEGVKYVGMWIGVDIDKRICCNKFKVKFATTSASGQD